MPEMLPSRKIIQVLKEHGFILVSQKGSHKKFKKNGRIVIVPDPKKEIPKGTFWLRPLQFDRLAFFLNRVLTLALPRTVPHSGTNT